LASRAFFAHFCSKESLNLGDNKNDLGRHHRFQPRKFVQLAQIEPLYYHENKSLERFPGSSTVEHSAVNGELQE